MADVVPESLLGGGDKPGARPRFPAGAGALSGTYTTTERLRATGYGYVAIRYQSRFPGIIRALEIRARVVEEETAEEIRDDAASRAPVHKGDPYDDVYGHHPGILRDSLYVVEHDSGDGYAVASDVHYAPYVEFGTKNMAAQPFLVPAMEANRESFIARMAAGVQRL